jgi:selenocysteine-specific elongation factor
MALLRGDRVILRRPSPATTVGGGVVVDPVPRRHKRFQRDVIERLEVMAQGTPEDLVLQALGDRAVEVGELERESGMDGIRDVVEALVERGEVVTVVGNGGAIGSRTVVLRGDTMRRMQDAAVHLLDEHHRRFPLLPGPRRDELRAALGIRSQRVFDEVAGELERRDMLRSHGAHVAAPGFTISLNPGQRELADRFLAAARAGVYSPPAPQEHGLSAELLAALRSLGEVVQVADQIAYPADVFADIQARVLDHLERQTTITLGEYRDLFGTSRKFAQPTLEYLDERRITRRKGDVRVRYVGPGAGS